MTSEQLRRAEEELLEGVLAVVRGDGGQDGVTGGAQDDGGGREPRGVGETTQGPQMNVLASQTEATGEMQQAKLVPALVHGQPRAFIVFTVVL